jgi:hypothetical protein
VLVSLHLAAAAPGAPGADVVLVSGMFAASVTFAFWWALGHAVTLAHEGGHAVTVVLLGGRVTNIAVNHDRTGLTSYFLGAYRDFFVAFNGYVGPSLFGVVGAVVLRYGYPSAVLWGSLVLLALALLVASTWFGRGVIVTVGWLLFTFARSGSVDLQLFAACAWIWFLLVGGLVHIVKHGRHGADHGWLRDHTLIPTIAWAVVFGAVAVASIVTSAAILLGMVELPG